MNKQAGKFARIVIPTPLKEPLIYKVPDPLWEQIEIGMRVLIPLGKRKVTGVVLELLHETVVPGTRAILAPLDERPILDSALLQLSHWVGQYYLAALGEVFGTILPPSLRSETQRTITLNPGNFYVADGLEKRILDRLRQSNGKLSVKRLTREMHGGNLYAAIERLESIGAVKIHERLPSHRTSSEKILLESGSGPTFKAQSRFILNSEQEQAFRKIEQRLKEGGFETFLLHGVTGSGKTEVYLRAMEQARAAGRGSLILIPEISLTPQLIDRVSARFPGIVGILHSGLSAAQRWAQWWHIVRGNVDVVVGARSAVFAPLANGPPSYDASWTGLPTGSPQRSARGPNLQSWKAVGDSATPAGGASSPRDFFCWRSLSS